MKEEDFKNLMKYQELMRSQVIKETNTDRKIELLSIINRLTAGPKNIVQKEHIILEAGRHGFSVREIEVLLDQLIQDNIIYRSGPGMIKKK